MRITANIPDNIGQAVKVFADNEKKSVSSVIADAVCYYIHLSKKQESGKRVLGLIGKARVEKTVHDDIASMRKVHDRY